MIAGDIARSGSTSTWTCIGGGSSTEALIGIAIGVMEAGLCKCVAHLPLDERLLAGAHRRHRRARRGTPVSRRHAAQREPTAGRVPDRCSAPSFMRHMHDHGTHARAGRDGEGRSIAEHASNNPKALLSSKRLTASTTWSSSPDHLQAAPFARLLRRDRQRDLRSSSPAPTACARPPPHAGADPRRGRAVQRSRAWTCTTRPARSSRVAGYYAQATSSGQTRASGPEDVDATGAYDAFTFTTMLQLEDYGFCKKGEGGDYVSSTAPCGSAASDRTTRRAAISARATPTA